MTSIHPVASARSWSKARPTDLVGLRGLDPPYFCRKMRSINAVRFFADLGREIVVAIRVANDQFFRRADAT